MKLKLLSWRDMAHKVSNFYHRMEILKVFARAFMSSTQKNALIHLLTQPLTLETFGNYNLSVNALYFLLFSVFELSLDWVYFVAHLINDWLHQFLEYSFMHKVWLWTQKYCFLRELLLLSWVPLFVHLM